MLWTTCALLAGGVMAVPALATAAPKPATPTAPLYHELPAWVQKAGHLNVGTSLAFPPYDFNTASNTTVIGFEPDLDKALSQLLGVPFVLHVAQFPQLVLGVASHRFDIAIDGVSDSRAREKQVDFVDYGQAALVILTPTKRGEAGQVGRLDLRQLPRLRPGHLRPADLSGHHFAVQAAPSPRAEGRAVPRRPFDPAGTRIGADRVRARGHSHRRLGRAAVRGQDR